MIFINRSIDALDTMVTGSLDFGFFVGIMVG